MLINIAQWFTRSQQPRIESFKSLFLRTPFTQQMNKHQLAHHENRAILLSKTYICLLRAIKKRLNLLLLWRLCSQ